MKNLFRTLKNRVIFKEDRIIMRGLELRVMRELEKKLLDHDLWASAELSQEFDEKKALATYIKLRADSLWKKHVEIKNYVWKTDRFFSERKEWYVKFEKIPYEIGDWTGKIHIITHMPYGEGEIRDLYGNISKTKQKYEIFENMLKFNSYKLPKLI